MSSQFRQPGGPHTVRAGLANPSRNARARTVLARACLLEGLEARALFSTVGGGWLAGGLVGEYFANTDFSGTPTFTRRDVRIDFDWGTTTRPGGSTSPGYREVDVDNYSIRWTGQLAAQYSELYTFKAFADDQFKMQIRRAGTTDWTTVIDQLAADANGTTGQMSLLAGQTYDVRVDYVEVDYAATAKLYWTSPSTPWETINPAVDIGFNVDGSWNQAFTDIVKQARNTFSNVDSLPSPALDANGWPMGSGSYIWQESFNQGLDLDPMTRGTISFSFHGKAELQVWGNVVTSSLVSNYDPLTNLTTGSFQSQNAGINASYFYFRNSDRDGDYGYDFLPDNDGITDLKLMKPVLPDATTSFSPDTIFQPQLISALQNGYTTLRVDLNNANQESVWTDRTLPSYANQANGKATARLYSTGTAMNNGSSWEYRVMLANETGRDLYINIPMGATGWSASDTQSYVYKLAQLIKYGSDGVNPYTQPTANPVYPALNPNLKVYVELSNEYWNYGGDAFRQAYDLDAMVTADVDAYLNGGVSPTSDPRARPQDVSIYNYDNLTTAKSGTVYNSLVTWRKRKMMMRTAQISDIFRNVFGDDAMPGTSADPRVRPLYEWQYENANNSASDAMTFFENYYNNADGIAHVETPRVPSYYLYGGGGASYYGSGNQWGIIETMSDPSFEGLVLPSGYNANPAGSDWTFTGTAGIARDAGTTDDIPPGAWIRGDSAKKATSQMGYITGTGSISRSFTVPTSQTSSVYAISFKAVQHLTNTQKFQVLIDGVAVNARSSSQNGGYQPDQYSSGAPWIARIVSWTNSEYYQTMVFSASPGSTHTLQFVGMNSGQTAFIEDVQLSSVDAMYDGGMPAGGTFAAGQTPAGAYAARLAIQANWAAAYGIKYVTYEGGWALGGDTGGTPLQNYAKYIDSRSAAVNATALQSFYQAGGTLGTLGTYTQWPKWSDNVTPPVEGLLSLSSNPLWQGQLLVLGGLQMPITNGVTLAGPKQTLQNASAFLKNNTSTTSNTVNANGWLSWNVIAPVTGTYNVGVDAAAGSTLQIFVDGQLVDTFLSSDAMTRPPATFTLSPGLHSIRVKALATGVAINSITLRPGPGGVTGVALGVYEFNSLAYNATSGSPASIAPHVLVGPVTIGPGFSVNAQSAFKNGVLVQPGASSNNRFATDLATAIAKNEFLTFTVTPQAASPLAITSVQINTYFQNSPAARGVALGYSLNDGATFNTVTAYSGSVDTPTFDLSDIPLQDLTNPIIFRVYLYGGGNFTTLGMGNRAGNDLVIFGSAFNSPPVVVNPAAASPATVAGNSTDLSVLGNDNTDEWNLSYFWSAVGIAPARVAFTANGTNAAKNTSAIFIKAGTYDLQCRIFDGSMSIFSYVTVVVDPVLTQLSIAPGAAYVQAGQTQAFHATGFDQFGNVMPTPSVAWSLGGTSVGSIDSDGMYTASDTGPADVRATVGTITAASGVEVGKSGPTVALAATASAATVTGVSVALSTLGSDDLGEVGLNYTWSVLSGPSSVVFSDNGQNASKNTLATFNAAGTYTFGVAITDATGKSTTSTVSVNVARTPSMRSNAPADVTVGTGQTREFTTIVTDQFGTVIAGIKPFWTIRSGPGWLTKSGRFTAPAMSGKTVIESNFGPLNVTATINTVAWAPYNLSARKTGGDTVAVSFKNAAAVNTGFQLQVGARQTSGAVLWKTIYPITTTAAAGATVTYAIPTSFASGTWSFRVRAISDTGNSPWSNNAVISL